MHPSTKRKHPRQRDKPILDIRVLWPHLPHDNPSFMPFKGWCCLSWSSELFLLEFACVLFDFFFMAVHHVFRQFSRIVGLKSTFEGATSTFVLPATPFLHDPFQNIGAATVMGCDMGTQGLRLFESRGAVFADVFLFLAEVLAYPDGFRFVHVRSPLTASKMALES